jgi:CheY-like chemotaxis protein
MPEMDGFVFAEELHKHPEWRSIPIVVMTNKDITSEDRQRLNGFVETVLRKSEYSRDELLNKVRGLIATYAYPVSTEGDGRRPPPIPSDRPGEEASTASG